MLPPLICPTLKPCVIKTAAIGIQAANAKARCQLGLLLSLSADPLLCPLFPPYPEEDRTLVEKELRAACRGRWCRCACATDGAVPLVWLTMLRSRPLRGDMRSAVRCARQCPSQRIIVEITGKPVP